MEPPIRIRLYGLVSVTKRGYIAQLVVAGIMLVALVVLWLYTRSKLDPSISEGVAHMRQMFDYLPWVVLAITLLYVLEATLVLRRFAREEAKRRAQPPPQPESPSPGPRT
jgi:hypothetical protein